MKKRFYLPVIFLFFAIPIILVHGAVVHGTTTDTVRYTSFEQPSGDTKEIQWTRIGRCGYGGSGTTIQHYKPIAIVETVHIPGQCIIKELQSTVKNLTNKVSNELDSCSGAMHSDTGNLQFQEAHVYTNQFKDVGRERYNSQWCTGGDGSMIRYLSETDYSEWRSQKTEQRAFAKEIALGQTSRGQQASQMRISDLAPLFPRIGFFVSSNPTMASAVGTVRALSITSAGGSAHVVYNSFDDYMNMLDDKIQLLYPFKTQAFPISLLSQQDWLMKSSQTQVYIWLYWKRYVCCVY